jgi:hypothetical protein
MSTIKLPNFYIAAELAGLRSAVQPQQGLTNTQVESISAAPSMYTKYNEKSLNDIAEQGTWIITQDYEGGDIYIRHQLTTDSKNGSLYYEDSVGVNIDEISYAINNILFKYIGKRNANAKTVTQVYNDVFTILFERTRVSPDIEIGPALLGFNSLTVGIDKVQKDRINVDVNLDVPLPLNSIVVNLRAYASFNEASATQSEAVAADGVGRLLDVSNYGTPAQR